MVLEFNSSIRHYKKVFFKNYFLYTLLGFFILLNVLFFPELLNNELIKLNDMSYLLPESSKVRYEKIIKIENSENKLQPVENNQIVSGEKAIPVNVQSENVNVPRVNNNGENEEKNNDKDNSNNAIAKTNSGNFIGEIKHDAEPTIKDIPFKQETEEAIKKTNSSYLLIFTLILLVLILSFGLFIHKNMETIKLTFNTRKGYNIREFINQGYELLEDE